MKIRNIILAGTLVFSMGLMMTGCTGDDDKTVLIMSEVQEVDHPTGRASDKFAELVKKKTKGRIEIEVYHGDQLGKENEQVAQVSIQGIDFARVSSSQLSKFNDNLKALQALYLYNDEDSMWKVMDGAIGDELRNSPDLANNGIEGLCWFSGGSRNFYNNKKVVKTPQDLAGLNLRVNTDSMFALMDKCGATGINIAYNDIYNSINAGVIDGAENNWPSYISTEHYKAAPYITIDEHTRIPEMIIASKATMDSLSPEDAEIIRECAKEAALIQREWLAEFDQEAIETAEAEGCTITYLTEAEVAEFQKLAKPINAEVSAEYIDLINRIQAAQ